MIPWVEYALIWLAIIGAGRIIVGAVRERAQECKHAWGKWEVQTEDHCEKCECLRKNDTDDQGRQCEKCGLTQERRTRQ